MENKAHALAAGIFVAVLTALVLVLAAWLTRDTGIRDIYAISTREAVTGLQEQAAVRFRGVDVGKVTSVGFDPTSPGSVLVKLAVDREAPITRDTFAVLSFQGVTGLAFVQLSDEGRPSPRLEPNDAEPPRIPLRPGILAKLEARGDVILEQVEQVTVRINKMLGDENQARVASALDNVSKTAASTSLLVQRLDQTVAQRIDPLLTQAGTTLTNVQRNLDDVGRAAAEVNGTAAEFRRAAVAINAPDGPIQRLSQGSDAFSQAADVFSRSTLPRVNRTLDEASRTVRSLARAVDELTDNPQALLYGDGAARPGPGEPGFSAPGGAR
jgi:phospholipid/cholesterol/gamma-HCH transport system substrate-binding protein